MGQATRGLFQTEFTRLPDSDPLSLLETWPGLPASVRQALLCLIKASSGEKSFPRASPGIVSVYILF